MRRFPVAIVLCLSIASCRPAATNASSDEMRRDIITYEEIRAATVPGWSAWDLITRLRPHFLTSKSAQTLREREPVEPVVYLDEMAQGGLESLKTLPISQIRSIQLLSSYDATTRYGTYMAGGAIVIRTH